LLEQKMSGGVNGACEMNTTTPMKKNEKNKTEQSKNRDKPFGLIPISLSIKIEDFLT